MAITVSTIRKYAISRDNGATWLYFPKQPNANPSPTGMNPADQRIDGTRIVPMFYNFELRFNTMTPQWWLTTVGMFDIKHQNILLNYRGVGYDIVNGTDYQERWYAAPAIWGEMPTANPEGPLYKDVTIRFSMLEYYIPGM